MTCPRRALAALVAVLCAAGCASTQPYTGLAEKNLRVRIAATGASIVMSVHRLDDKCFAHYEGSVTLDRPALEVGLPPDRLSLLVFDLYVLGVVPGARSVGREAKLTPRAGYRYEARVSYKDSLYDVELLEIDPRSGAARELDTRRGC